MLDHAQSVVFADVAVLSVQYNEFEVNYSVVHDDLRYSVEKLRQRGAVHACVTKMISESCSHDKVQCAAISDATSP